MRLSAPLPLVRAARGLLLTAAPVALRRPIRAAVPEWAEAQAPGQWIVAFPSSAEDALREQGVSIWDRDEGVVLGGAADAQLAALATKGIAPLLTVPDHGEWMQI